MYPKLIEQLIDRLCKLPGIGRRGAERIVFWLLDHNEDDVLGLSHAMVELKKGLKFCRQCNSLTDQDVCTICQDTHRSDAVCVVESPKDLIAIEKTGIWKGQYYVLLGTIAPSEGRGPDDLNLHKLMRRIDEGGVKEVVIATDADAEGEMTAMHLVKVLKPKGVKVSRIGLGIPMGSSVEFADLSTLSMSINARREMGEHVGH